MNQRVAVSALLLGTFAIPARPQAQHAAPTVTLLSKTYHLGSYSQKDKPTWEFITGDETIDGWTTLVTIIERADAHTRAELDSLSQGIMETYKSHGAQVLSAKTMDDGPRGVFNYMVVGFEEPDKHRMELNFVRMGLGAKNAYVIIYGVRVTDPGDYRAKAKKFLDEQSSPVGMAVGHAVLPDINTLPRKEF